MRIGGDLCRSFWLREGGGSVYFLEGADWEGKRTSVIVFTPPWGSIHSAVVVLASAIAVVFSPAVPAMVWSGSPAAISSVAAAGSVASPIPIAVVIASVS
jgi:hypothetical protein